MTDLIRTKVFAVLYVAAVSLFVPTIAQCDPPATPSADRMNRLLTEMMEAQTRGDEARVREIGAEMEALAPRVQAEMNAVVEAAQRQASVDMRQRLQDQVNAMQQAQNAPEWKISQGGSCGS